MEAYQFARTKDLIVIPSRLCPDPVAQVFTVTFPPSSVFADLSFDGEDVKDNRPELLHAVWNLPGEYESWITTAPKSADKTRLEEFSAKPVLVLTEDSDAQEKVCYDEVPVGSHLRLFGSAHTNQIPGETQAERAHQAARMPPDHLLTEHPTNYRRWWNNSCFGSRDAVTQRWKAALDAGVNLIATDQYEDLSNVALQHRK
jgi:hypothetical protein